MCVGITSHSARAKGATQEAHLFLIAAFCRLAKSLSHSEQMGWLVGAVGIEIASLTSKSFSRNGLAPPPHSIWSRLEPVFTDSDRYLRNCWRKMRVLLQRNFGASVRRWQGSFYPPGMQPANLNSHKWVSRRRVVETLR